MQATAQSYRDQARSGYETKNSPEDRRLVAWKPFKNIYHRLPPTQWLGISSSNWLIYSYWYWHVTYTHSAREKEKVFGVLSKYPLTEMESYHTTGDQRLHTWQ